MRQQLSKHAEIDMHIKDRELSLQRRRREGSRRSSGDDARKATRDVHLNEESRLREHVSMISVSANAATYHDDGDDDEIDTAMSFTLAHELARITTMLQRKKLIS